MKKAIITTFAVLMFLTQVSGELKPVVAMDSVAVSTFKDIKGHWAESSINAAIKHGYVNGYADGSFRPEGKVTRAEFIKMVVLATETSVNSIENPKHWYEAYVLAAKNAGVFMDGDFDSNWNKIMTRSEMARVAVRTIGEKPADENQIMYIATKKGVISGVGNGNLDPEGTTTRAQAVAVIQRIQQVNRGKVLPIDQLALKKAEELINAKKDDWGRAIRTTNLPKNYKEYPYILENIPNEMYEMSPLKAYKGYMNTLEYMKHEPREINPKTISIWKKCVEDYYSLILNVDYRNIDYKWAENVQKQYNPAISQLSQLKKYVDWVKKNKIQIQGSLIAEPSIVYYAGNGKGIVIRSKFKFEIINYDKNENVLFDSLILNANISKGYVYEGFADIQMSTNVGGRWGETLKVSPMTSLFNKNTIINKVKK